MRVEIKSFKIFFIHTVRTPITLTMYVCVGINYLHASSLYPQAAILHVCVILLSLLLVIIHSGTLLFYKKSLNVQIQ